MEADGEVQESGDGADVEGQRVCDDMSGLKEPKTGGHRLS